MGGSGCTRCLRHCRNSRRHTRHTVHHRHFRIPRADSFCCLCSGHGTMGVNRLVSVTLISLRGTGHRGLGDRSNDNVFHGVDFGDDGLNRIGSHGIHVGRLLRSFTSRGLRFSRSRLSGGSIVNSTCVFLVRRFTDSTNGGTKRFFAPGRISALLTGLAGGTPNSHVYSPAYNSNSLLVGTNHRINSSGFSLCNRRLGNDA